MTPELTLQAIIRDPTPAQDKGLLAVPLENLLPGWPLNFGLYQCIEGDHVLLRGAGKCLGKDDRSRLLQDHVTQLYILEADIPRYKAYLDGLLKGLLVDPGLSVAVRAETFYSLATGIGREVLRFPDRPESIASAAEVVRTAFSFLAGGREMLHRIMHLMMGQQDLAASAVNVTNYGLALAWASGVRNSPEVLDLGLGLFLHDVGLRMIPEKIQEKKGPLSFEEICIWRQHPMFGVDLYERQRLLPARAIGVIRDHHERCDGSGYPRGIAAGSLSMEARIAQIATTFDELTTSTLSRRAVSSFEAVRSMCRDQSTAFDRELLRRFIALIGGEDPIRIGR